MFSLDLDTLKIDRLVFSPAITIHAQTCKINKNTYFFQNGPRCTETYLINTMEKTFEQLKPGPAKYGAGSVFKDDKVYIFGGSPHGRNSLSTCETYDLKTKMWTSIGSLPYAARFVTAGLIGKDIILSG